MKFDMPIENIKKMQSNYQIFKIYSHVDFFYWELQPNFIRILFNDKRDFTTLVNKINPSVRRWV